MKKFLERDENELTNIQCLWDTAKAVLRGTFIEIQAYLNKQTNKQTNKQKQKQTRNISNKQPNPTPTRNSGTTTKTNQSK